VYPAPKDAEDYVRHPLAPSAARRDALAEPWEEAEGARPLKPDRLVVPGKAPFDAVPSRTVLFGYVDGHGVRDDLGFYRSVHLPADGEGLTGEAEAARRRELEEWTARLVVDNARFVPHFSRGIESTDKYGDTLDGEVKKVALRIVHNAKLPSGRATSPPRAAPVSAFAGEAYVPPRDFTLSLKPNDPAHYMGRDATGATVAFATRIHRDLLKPKSQTVRSTRAISPIRAEERRGPRWAARGSNA
jgi:hypothetical protein